MNEEFSLPSELKAALARRAEAKRQQLMFLWKQLGALESPCTGAPDTVQAWAELSARLRAVRPARRPRRRMRARWSLVAIFLIGIIGIGLLWFAQPHTLTVPLGTLQTVTLNDGSTILLRGGSRLVYPRSLSGSRPRWIRLQGEALFSIASGPSLSIHTAWAQVEVLGTRLGIRAWPETPETQVTLLEGRVRVRATAQPSHMLLLQTPRQHVRLGIGHPLPAEPDVINLEQAFAWRQGGFVVIDQSVASVLRELERSFGLRIEVEGTLPLTRRITILYQRDARPERILQDLCLSLPCYYRRISRGFVLVPDSTAGP